MIGRCATLTAGQPSGLPSPRAAYRYELGGLGSGRFTPRGFPGRAQNANKPAPGRTVVRARDGLAVRFHQAFSTGLRVSESGAQARAPTGSRQVERDLRDRKSEHVLVRKPSVHWPASAGGGVAGVHSLVEDLHRG